jgi:hypothetical protein
MFATCDSLKEVEFVSGVTAIGFDVFLSCPKLEKVYIPEGVTKIYSWAFWKCSSLSTVVFPSTLTEVGNYTFQYCGSMLAIFKGVPPLTGTTSIPTVNGCYFENYASEWEAKIDSKGKWLGMHMTKLPTGISADMGEWLIKSFPRDTAGKLTLKNMTEKDFEDAYLLNISPSITSAEGEVLVEVKGLFNISSIEIDGSQAVLNVIVEAEVGELSNEFSLNGIVKVKARKTLEDAEITYTPIANVVRIDNTQALITVTIDALNYRFYQVIIE